MTRSFTGAFAWSCRLLCRRPSVLGAFVLIGVMQLLAAYGFVESPGLSATIGLVGVFLGRGYVGVVGAAELGRGRDRFWWAIKLVGGRFPAFTCAFALVAGLLAVVVLFVAVGLSTALVIVLEAVAPGVESVAIDAVLLLLTVTLLTFVLVKFCFVPEACFVGGYGPIEALRVSWQLTDEHRRKAVLLTFGLFVLFGIGALLDTQFVAVDRPVALSITLQETTVTIRSLGLSTASIPRLLVDASLSALYYAVFVHQYVDALFER